MEQAVVKILLLGICGYGSNYIKEISERDIPGIKIEGICEVVPNAADLYPIIKEQNIPIYQTPEDFYKEHTADLAVVSTPIHLHYSQIVTCLTHGSNVLTEKPVCTSVEGARKLEQLEKETGKPDLSTPMIGDADRDDLTTRRCDTSLYEGMNLTFDPYDLNEMRAYFRTWYEETGREDFRFMATAGKEGTPPAQRNYKYIPAGIYVMRTGWGPEDSYFHVHGIQLERGEVSSHSHNDTGHVEIHARGEDILTDSGRYIYNSSCWKDWRHYFLSAKAHNTLYVDDHEMGTVPGVTRTRGVRTYLHAFEENEQYQLIDISHNGYDFMDDPMFHRRRVVRLPDDIYVIEDRVTGICREDHDIRLYYNFAFGHLDGENGKFDYTSQKGRGYTMTVQADKKLDFEILEGSEDPIGGWISYGYAWRKPIPQLIAKHSGKAPIHFITVLAPAGTRAEAAINGDAATVTLAGGKVLTLTENAVELR